MTVTATSNT